MECEKVKGFLSEYIDGVLDAQVKKLVEEHLSACRSCSEELASLKACIKELGALKGVEAPGDFLEKVHERIEHRGGLGEIIRALFVPFYIKVPLEIGAIAATIILSVSLMESKRETVYMPPNPRLVTMAKKPAGEPIASIMPQGEEMAKLDAGSPPLSELEREVTEQPITLTAMAPPQAPVPAEEKPIELALLIKPEATAETYARGYPVEKDKKSRADKLEAGLEVRSMNEVSSEIGEKKLSAGYGLSYAPRKESEAAEDEDKIIVSSPYLNEAISKVKNLIELVDGKVISVQETPPQYIATEIPAKNFGKFVEKLSSLGELQKPTLSLTAKDEEPIRLQINLIPTVQTED